MGKTKNKTKKPKKIFHIIVYLFFGFAIALTLYYVSLPNVSKLQGSILIDRKIKKGADYITIPYTVGEKNRNFVPLNSISKHLKDAVIVAEDIEFYHHKGFNLQEIEQAIKTNIERGRFARGASTITQQLMKNIYLSGEKTLFRKLSEAALTFKAELTLSKDRILELYLNVIEWGWGIYGAKMAAAAYFKKSPSELSPMESAYLAAIIPAPRRYGQAKKGSDLEKYVEKRRNTILWWMGKAGYLDLKDEKTADKKDAGAKEIISIMEKFQPEEAFREIKNEPDEKQ